MNNSPQAKRARAREEARQADQQGQQRQGRERAAERSRAFQQARRTIQAMLARGLSGARNVTERFLTMARNMGADLTEAICQYAIRPTSNPEETALVVYGEIPTSHPYHLLTEGTYTYILPKAEHDIRESIARGEKTDPGNLLQRLIQNEENLGNELIQLYKALIASLKGLQSYLLAKKWKKEEVEPLIKLVFSNLLMVLVKKHLKELHNMEARLHLIRTGQKPREGYGGADCSQYTFEGRNIQLFDPIMNNILNTLIASWPHIAIEMHLNPGVIVHTHGELLSDEETNGTEPEILGSFESAEEYVRGPLKEYLAAQWATLEPAYVPPAAPLSANMASSIAKTGVQGARTNSNRRSVRGLFDREVSEQERDTVQSVRGFVEPILTRLADNLRYINNLVQFSNDSQFSEGGDIAIDEEKQTPAQIQTYLQSHRFPERTCVQAKDEGRPIPGAGTGLFGGYRKRTTIRHVRKTKKAKKTKKARRHRIAYTRNLV